MVLQALKAKHKHTSSEKRELAEHSKIDSSMKNTIEIPKLSVNFLDTKLGIKT